MSSINIYVKEDKKTVFLDIDFFCCILFCAMREMRVKIPRWPATVKLSCRKTNEVGMPYCNNN